MQHPSAPNEPAAPTTRVIGVLGGIASGKSAVARWLAGPDGVVIDADRYAREVLQSPEVVARLADAFGSDVVGQDGSVCRETLAARAFRSPADRAALEAFTHPLIRDRIRAALRAARAQGVPRIVLDVPLLLENESQHGLASECHDLVFVDADERARDVRAVAERGWKPGEVARREAHQMPLSQKRARANHVIQNRGTLAELEAEARSLRSKLDPAKLDQR